MSIATYPEIQTNFPSIAFNQQELEAKLSSINCNQSLTGYWQIYFNDNQGLDDPNKDIWYLFLCKGRVVFSCFQPISPLVVLESLKVFLPSFRTPAVEEKIQEIQKNPKEENSSTMLVLLSELTLKAKLISYQEVVEAIKLKILTDIEKYLFDYSGKAEFIVDENLKDDRPVIGFELEDLILTAKQRRTEWEQIRPFVPSMDSIVYGNTQQIERQNLTAPQKKQLKQLIRSGQSIQQISSDLGQDCLKVAQTFAKLVQKGLVTFDPDNCFSIAPPETSPDINKPAQEQRQTPVESTKPAQEQRYSLLETTKPAVVEQPQILLESTKPPVKEIFIVDDSMVMLKNFKALVTELGYSVHCCSDAIKAVESMLVCKPAVIFLDLNMPGVSGFQLIKQIRSLPSLASIPIVVLTAEKSMLNKQRAKWSKSKFLSKPLNTDEIPQFKSELEALLQEFAPLS